MGSWLMGDGDLSDALVGKRIEEVEVDEGSIYLTVEGGLRITFSAPAPEAPPVEAWAPPIDPSSNGGEA